MSRRPIASILFACSLALLGAGCSWFATTDRLVPPVAPPAITVPVENTPTTTTEEIPPTVKPVTQSSTFTTVHVVRRTERAEINVSYPQLHDSYSAETVAAFNQAVSSSVSGFLIDFEKNVAGIDTSLTTKSFPWTMDMDARVVLRSDELIAVYGEGSLYTGGAHANAFYIEVLFDIKNKKALAVKELFTDPAQALKVLSDRAIGKLTALNTSTKFSDAKLIKEGAGAEWSNFAFLYPTRTGLTVTFPPYQVAPYTSGQQSIHFKYGELSSILKPRFKGVVTNTWLWETNKDEANSFGFRLPTDLAHYNGGHIDYTAGVSSVVLPNDTIKSNCLANYAGRDTTVLETLTIKGMRFCHTVAQEPGMSQMYRTDSFTTITDTKAITLSFTARYLPDPRILGGCEDGKSTEEACALFDENKDTALYKQILDTFTFDLAAMR